MITICSFFLTVSLIGILGGGLTAGSTVVNERRIISDDDDNINNIPEIIRRHKRETQGSCTCTCETRPVRKSSNRTRPADNHPPSTPHILRTGHVGAGENKMWNYNNHADLDPVEDYRSSDLLEKLWKESKDYNNINNDISPIRPEDGNWGHASRFPWKQLPDTVCYRRKCESDEDCCRGFNLCDKTAKVCVDCWYGSSCFSEEQCCQKFPYCKRPNTVDAGMCVDIL